MIVIRWIVQENTGDLIPGLELMTLASLPRVLVFSIAEKVPDDTTMKENLPPREVVSDREHLNDELATFMKKGNPQSTSSVKREKKNHNLPGQDEKKLLNVIQTSPNTSILSHDSTGTFYTDLPSMIAAATATAVSFQGEALSSFQDGKQ